MPTETVEVTFKVPPPLKGERVDSYLVSRLRGYSRSRVQKLIAEGKVRVRGRRAKAAARVDGGDAVVVLYPRIPEPPCAIDRLPVLFEDESLLAVAKPAGMLSHPTHRVLRNAATAVLCRQFPGLSLRLAHRLDRETSGVLLFSKTLEAARALFGQFFKREIEKEYLAIIRGKTEFKKKIVSRPLEREGGMIRVRQTGSGADGRPAVSEIEILAASDALSLALVRPRTGRLHQIRVHLSELGHPVLGDKLYQGDGEYYMKAVRRELAEGDYAALGAARQMLHAWRLRIRHPAAGTALELRAPVPEDFLACAASRGLKIPGGFS